MNWDRTLRGSHIGRVKKHKTRKETGKKQPRGRRKARLGWGYGSQANLPTKARSPDSLAPRKGELF